MINMECWFHYGQCVFNKIVEIGLKKDYDKIDYSLYSTDLNL